MTHTKKKKKYLLYDQNGDIVNAELRENGKLSIFFDFPALFKDETDLYSLFYSVGWTLKHEEFVPDTPHKEETFIPPKTTFH